MYGKSGWPSHPARIHRPLRRYAGFLWGIPHFTERLRDALAWLDRYPGFKIGLENEAYMYDYLAEHDPKLIAEIRASLARYA